jgi:ribonuclease HII
MVGQQLSLLSEQQLLKAELSDFLWEQIAGVDEVGRGALFGPVVAAAVILPGDSLEALAAAGVTDSKKVSAAQRQRLAAQIQAIALDWQIGTASVREIDRFNILQASLLAMKRAILRLQVPPTLCLIDGNQRIPALPIAQRTLIKGDQRSLVVAAASIMAKVWRDELMVRLALKYPDYDIAANKGYGSARHRLALKQLGRTIWHRRSFSPCRSDPVPPLEHEGQGCNRRCGDGAPTAQLI